ncbi:response regulator [Halostella sp. PRR32]|uniref:response regulator n=1 Tax=Halostella sp. PRR32 TaxID=3098147 RepID=UPI002B1D130D|nr:response regulator [Halostella sp. PRR32]
MTDEPTVLVVDDEDKLADMYVLWLRQEYEVRTAYDAQAAVDELDDSVDVVLLDRRMPGVSGDRLLDEFADDPPFSVIMITAVEPDFDIIDMAFDDYLCKPVQHDDLTAAIDYQIAVQGRDDRLRKYSVARAKLAVLEAEKSRHELSNSSTYGELQSTAQRLESVLEDSVPDFDEVDEEFQAIGRTT